IQMPNMDGYEAAAAIRLMEDPAIADIPIVAMTANAFSEDREKALKCGMNGHIPKPIDTEKLHSTIHSVVMRIAE
ncbi:MAG: response regulator, partial [Lachnospiraceae bacterium]|nr:response regulator [Lachnospiraceae bacterium]